MTQQVEYEKYLRNTKYYYSYEDKRPLSRHGYLLLFKPHSEK